MTPEELLVYINDDKSGLSAMLKEYFSKKKRKSNFEKRTGLNVKGDKKVEFWDGYTEAVEHYESTKIHSSGEFPYYLFKVLAPLQEKEELEYLQETYQPITKDVFLEFSNTAKKAVQNGHIEFQKTEDEDNANELQSYLDNDIKNFNSLKLWAAAMLDQKLVDANGIFAVWPYYELNDEGIIVGETDPQPCIYNVDRILWKKNGEYLVLTSKKTMSGGLILRYFGKEYIAQFNQVGDLKDYQFDITRSLEHQIGFTPAQELKGIAVIDDEDIHYESIFNICVSHLNLAVIDSVTLLAIKKKVGYPTRVVMREKCGYSTGDAICEDGYISVSDGKRMIKDKCPQCRGTGYIGVFGPMSELSINADNSLSESSGINAGNAMAYVGPSTEIPKFLREEIERHIARAKEVLHLRSEPRGSGNITATEKNRDKENTEAFIKPISDQLWDGIAFIIECIGVMKFGRDAYDNSLKPKVIPAQSFDLLGPDDYIAEMAEAKKAGVPEVVIQNIVYKYMAVMHHDDTLSMKIYQLIEMSDRLLTLSNDQVAIAQSRGTVAPWEAVLHQSSTYIVSKTIMEYEAEGNRSFWDLNVSDQIDQVQNTARQTVPVTQTTDTELPQPIEP